MGKAHDDFAAHRNSPEHALCHAVPLLELVSGQNARCAAAGTAMEARLRWFLADGLRQAPLSGPSVSGKPGILDLGRRARAALERVLELWDGGRTPDGRCPPSDAIAAAAETGSGPDSLPWLSRGAARQAFMAELSRMEREAVAERLAEATEHNLTSLSAGSEVALCGIDGDARVISRVVGGSPEDGFEIEGGRRLDFRGTTPGRWIVRGGSGEGFLSARAAVPSDPAMIALRFGRLSDAGRTLRAAAVPSPEAAFVARHHVPADPYAHPWSASSAPGDWNPRAGFMPQDDGLRLDAMVAEVLPGGSHGDLLAYMIRRFGPPGTSTDGRKSLCAAWMLTTPAEGLLLKVEPSASGLASSFRAFASPGVAAALGSLHDARRILAWNSPEGADTADAAYLKGAAPYSRALRAALCDLLRPVHVRDHPLNALGTVPSGSPLLRLREGADGDRDRDYVHGVAPSDASTVAMPAGFFDDGDALGALLEGLRRLDPADPARAMRLFAEMASRAAPDAAGRGRGPEAGP